MALTAAETIAHCTVRLECTLSDGSTSTGTGFFFSFAKNGERYIPAIVTNKHVVRGASRGRFILTLRDANGGPAIGKTISVELDTFEARWIQHSDLATDLCAMPIAPLLQEVESKGGQAFCASLDESLLPTDAEHEQLDQLEEITMVGYPIGLWDRTNNMPVFRRGSTATHPALDWNGKAEFLIDAACFPGSSGSPVFLFNKSGYSDRLGTLMVGTPRLKLLGVLYAGPQYVADGKLTVVPVPTMAAPLVRTSIPLNLGVVIKSRMLQDLDAQLRALVAGAG